MTSATVIGPAVGAFKGADYSSDRRLVEHHREAEGTGFDVDLDTPG